jgi:hypothetical protein
MISMNRFYLGKCKVSGLYAYVPTFKHEFETIGSFFCDHNAFYKD